MYFNPLRREGGDDGKRVDSWLFYRISIHSAARAETYTLRFIALRLKISIHSAARAETLLAKIAIITDQKFQSTPPRGRRRGGIPEPDQSWYISIHSAARAETVTCMIPYGGDVISIHSAARAETGEHSRFSRPDGDFNPLRREGGDVLSTKRCLAGLNFNPLRREGGDTIYFSTSKQGNRFQSTPPRGRRPRPPLGHRPYPAISIHSAARAETISV